MTNHIGFFQVNFYRSDILLLALIVSLWAGVSSATQRVTSTFELGTVDWTSGRIKFSAHSSKDLSKDASYQQMEKSAWAEGVSVAANLSAKIAGDHYKKSVSDDVISSIKERASRSVYSRNTYYSSAGSVGVDFEMRLARALSLEKYDHAPLPAKEVVGELSVSGIVFRYHCAASPRADLVLQNNIGEKVFSPASIAKSIYSDRLVGPWVKKPSRNYISKNLGNSPAEVKVYCTAGGFQVDTGDWASVPAAERSLILASGRILHYLNAE